jgi:hypothetical protein
LEYCPYCQRLVEPTKSNTDILAGAALGGWFGGVVGTGHYLLKGPRCPICNNTITRESPPAYVPQPTQAYPYPIYLQYSRPTYLEYPRPAAYYPAMVPQGTHPQVTQPVRLPPSRQCPYCRQPVAYAPNLRQWYCSYCHRTLYPYPYF